MNCIFCQIIAGQAPASIIYQDERCLAFMDIQPVNPGHLLVIPRQHAPDLASLHPQDGAHIFQVGQSLAAALRRSELCCEGIDLFLADGAAAGQEIFHVHLHVIPRFSGDGFGFHFAPGYYDRPSRQELDQAVRKILQAISTRDS